MTEPARVELPNSTVSTAPEEFDDQPRGSHHRDDDVPPATEPSPIPIYEQLLGEQRQGVGPFASLDQPGS
jgi:hypothetical protein